MDFTSKLLSIQFSKVVLKQNLQTLPRVYEGSGSITRDIKGQLELKALCYSDITLYEYLDDIFERDEDGNDVGFLSSSIVGNQVPKSRYFSLFAIDLEGKEWESVNILLDSIDSNISTNQILLTTRIHEISCRIGIQSDNRRMSLVLHIDQEVDSISQSLLISESRRLHIPLRCDYLFTLKRYKEYLVVEVISPFNSLPVLFETRICEAFQFILSCLVDWLALELYQDNQKTLRIQSVQIGSYRETEYPPIRFRNEDTVECVWSLFVKYLRYILNFPEPEMHPISGWVRSIIKTRQTYIELQMLVLSVSVESIINKNFTDFVSEVNECNNLDQQILRVREWLADSDLENSFKQRLEGSLGAMKHVRPVDCLNLMKEKSLIKKELIDAWKKIRNESAHGRTVKPNEVKKFRNLCNEVIVLFNQLVFLTIGYTGRYTDYSKAGWNIKVFDKLVEKPDYIASSKSE